MELLRDLGYFTPTSETADAIETPELILRRWFEGRHPGSALCDVRLDRRTGVMTYSVGEPARAQWLHDAGLCTIAIIGRRRPCRAPPSAVTADAIREALVPWFVCASAHYDVQTERLVFHNVVMRQDVGPHLRARWAFPVVTMDTDDRLLTFSVHIGVRCVPTLVPGSLTSTFTLECV